MVIPHMKIRIYFLVIFGTIITTGFTSAQEWSIQTISDDGLKPVISIDDADRVHMVYMLEDNRGWVAYALIQGEQVDTTLVSSGYFYGPPDIVVDGLNNPVIAYHDHDSQDQAVRHFEDGIWRIKDTPDPGHDGWDNALWVDGLGNIHTSSVDPSGFGGPGVEYGFFDGNGWTTEPVGSGGIMYAHATNIAMDSQGTIYITYFDDNAGRLVLANNATGSWANETIDPGPDAGRFASLYIDEKDDIYISYYKAPGFINLAMRKNNNWSIMEIDQLSNVEVSFSGARNLTSLDKHEDIIGIAYGDKEVVKFAVIGPNGIALDTVVRSSVQTFGQIVSFQFDSDWKAHIAYAGNNAYSNPNGNIFLASKKINAVSVEQNESHVINIFPNPVAKGSRIYIDNISHGFYQLINFRGQIIASGTFDGAIDIHHLLSEGTYSLHISSRRNHFIKTIIVH